MDEQFLQMQYEYYRKGEANNPSPLSYAQWKNKVQTCAVCPSCGGSNTPNKLSWLPYAIGGLLVGLYLKK